MVLLGKVLVSVNQNSFRTQNLGKDCKMNKIQIFGSLKLS